MGRFPFFRQLDQVDSGLTCLRMIIKHYGKVVSVEQMRDELHMSRKGLSLTEIRIAAEELGFRSSAGRISFSQLKSSRLPCIVDWKHGQFVVVYRIKRTKVHIANPGFGLMHYEGDEFIKEWTSYARNGDMNGNALFLEPTSKLFQQPESKDKLSLSFFFTYLTPYRRYFIQIFLGMFVAGALQLIFPFLTQSIVDIGINNQDIGFINLILLAQTMLFFSRTMIDFIRSWIMLHIGTRINVSIISDFLVKLMRLPVSFFERKTIGDLMQRIGDHRRVQNFMSSATLSTLFSFVSLIVFSIVLSYYSLNILIIFFLGSALYILWVVMFLKKRKELDYKFFQRSSANQNALLQLFLGIRDIKLHNSEQRKRWEWEGLQIQMLRMGVTSLRISQFQQIGSSFINEIKNIIITVTSAKLVVEGQISLGMMLSIQYIIGQLNGPISQLIGFLNSYQDAKISLERLNEIHNKEDEQQDSHITLDTVSMDSPIVFKDVSFQYEDLKSEIVLKNINLVIPPGDVTAIVGASGSGKTTLLKLLLKLYKPTTGKISAGGIDIWKINNRLWRENCGSVLQDGFIFSDTIANNIALSDETVDYKKLLFAVKVANIGEFIESLPLAFDTKIGSDGHGLSQGQRQRLLIARAVYKEPSLILLDEATNSLDATNESIIMNNLASFFKGRTVIIAAHRLSTITAAKQIIVMEKGEIVEQGNHEYLLSKRGPYFKLVQNQLLATNSSIGNLN